MAILTCEKVKKRYGEGDGTTWAVNGISYTFLPGCFYAIIGKSGAGKSTLLSMLHGSILPTEGRILLNQQDLAVLSFDELQAMRRKEFGFVYQNYRLLPELTIEENMILPALLDHQELDQVWIEKLLIDLGLQKLKNRKPAQTSGGEQQRCALARALFNRPEILFLDEPTGNLDKKNRNDVMRLLQSIHAHHQCTMILVTHDLEIARTADILLKMEDGYILQLTAGEEECETN